MQPLHDSAAGCGTGLAAVEALAVEGDGSAAVAVGDGAGDGASEPALGAELPPHAAARTVMSPTTAGAVAGRGVAGGWPAARLLVASLPQAAANTATATTTTTEARRAAERTL